MNGISGLISGTPAVEGTFNVTIRATNSFGTGAANLILVLESNTSPCDVNQDGSTNVLDVQQMTSQALGAATCAADINKDNLCNVIDVQRVTNAALGGACVSP